jgi:hypothetical protein
MDKMPGKTGLIPLKRPQSSYFGLTFGSPPGPPGGGMTGMVPPCGVGACISGSTPAGGHKTPSDFASLSPSEPDPCPVVVPFGATVFSCGTASVGVQRVSRAGLGGAVCAGGVAGAGGACATAGAAHKSGMVTNARESFAFMQGQRRQCADVPCEEVSSCGSE